MRKAYKGKGMKVAQMKCLEGCVAKMDKLKNGRMETKKGSSGKITALEGGEKRRLQGEEWWRWMQKERKEEENRILEVETNGLSRYVRRWRYMARLGGEEPSEVEEVEKLY